MPTPQQLESLHIAITERHGCDSLHAQSDLLVLPLPERPPWIGVVSVFELIGHPHAQRCYAWTEPRGRRERVVTVLEIPPVVSPAVAVKTFIENHH